MAKIGFTWAGYLGKLDKLRKNQEQVPLADLLSKYKKPYTELLQDIKADTETMLIRSLIGRLPFDMSEKAEWDSFVNRVNEIIREANKAGTFKEISRAVFREYDPDKALDIAAKTLWPKILYQSYAPYWIRHCKKGNDGRIWNDLICMRWQQEWQIWEAEDGTSWRIMLPPSEFQIKEEEERERKRIRHNTDRSAKQAGS